ncbi:MAG: hypothetical protein ACRDD1_19520, partial [Planctomycetia bacterium]
MTRRPSTPENTHGHGPGRSADLDWSAFRYAAGEMTAGEEAAFEDRLTADQSAREAVATAVEWTLAVSAGAVRPKKTRRPSRFVGAFGWSAAACLLAAAIFVVGRPLPIDQPNAASPTVERGFEVALAWSELRDARPTDADDDAPEPTVVDPEAFADAGVGPVLDFDRWQAELEARL